MATCLSQSDAERLRDAVRQLVFEKVAHRWSRIHRTGFFGRVVSPCFGPRRLKAIFVVEHDDADLAGMTCTGKAIGTWSHDHNGLRRLDTNEADLGPVYGHAWWGTIWDAQIWKFCIPPDSMSVVINEGDGPGSEWLSVNVVVLEGNGARLKFRSGRVRDDRPSTWWNTLADLCHYSIILLPVVLLSILLYAIKWLVDA